MCVYKYIYNGNFVSIITPLMGKMYNYSSKNIMHNDIIITSSPVQHVNPSSRGQSWILNPVVTIFYSKYILKWMNSKMHNAYFKSITYKSFKNRLKIHLFKIKRLLLLTTSCFSHLFCLPENDLLRAQMNMSNVRKTGKLFIKKNNSKLLLY